MLILRTRKKAVSEGGILANPGGSLECQPQTTNRYLPSLRDKLEY